MKIEEMPRESLNSILTEIVNSVDPKDIETWEDNEASEHCLVTISLPKGVADAAKKFFTEMCKDCDDEDCNRKDNVTNKFFDAIFHERINSLASMQIRGALSAVMQEM